MTKADLVEEVVKVSRLSKKHAEIVVLAVFDSITEALHRDDKIELRGFGSFRVRKRRSRQGRNPKTGDRVDVPEKRIPYFKPGKELRELINEAVAQAERAAEADDILGLLENHSRTPVPQNVTFSIRDWALRAGLMRLSKELELVCEDPEVLRRFRSFAAASLQRGEAARAALAAREYDVTWRTYAMAHSVCLDEIRDIREFLVPLLSCPT